MEKTLTRQTFGVPSQGVLEHKFARLSEAENAYKTKLRERGNRSAGIFPEIVAMLRELPAARFVVDGELVIEMDGRFAFDALQLRLHPADHG